MMEGHVTLLFLDESGFNTTPHVSRTWAPIGCTPSFIHPFTWYKLSVISAVTSNGKLFFRIHKKRAVKDVDIINFLRQILKQIGGRIIMYLDGLPQYRSKKMKKFLSKHNRMEVRKLPAYSPDMNLDEGVWSYIKTRMLPNLSIRSANELKGKVKLSLHRLQKRNDLIISFLLHSELTWEEDLREMLYITYKAQ
jgi:transposase